MVSNEIVEQVYHELEDEIPEERASEEMDSAVRRQEDLFAFVMGLTGELSENAQQLAVYLCFAFLRMFEASEGGPIGAITDEEIEAKWDENHDYFERLHGVDERFLEHIATGLGRTQPDVFAFLLEVLMNEYEDEDSEGLTDEELAELFFTLKTVIDLLDEKVAA